MQCSQPLNYLSYCTFKTALCSQNDLYFPQSIFFIIIIFLHLCHFSSFQERLSLVQMAKHNFQVVLNAEVFSNSHLLKGCTDTQNRNAGILVLPHC